ncbi:MAG: hypothetical protein Q8L92_18340, partial [Rubrivivax sp.]|nr:hypothetical protein [Rubrivivax sp.]
IDDGHGGTAMQTVTITLVGADDAVTKSAKGGGNGNGKGKGNDIELGAKAADVLFFLEMQHDQAAAPAASGMSVQGLHLPADLVSHMPESTLTGLAHLFDWTVL